MSQTTNELRALYTLEQIEDAWGAAVPLSSRNFDHFRAVLAEMYPASVCTCGPREGCHLCTNVSDETSARHEQARGGMAVATLLAGHPSDDSGAEGPWMHLDDWNRLRALPPGTKLYARHEQAQGGVDVLTPTMREVIVQARMAVNMGKSTPELVAAVDAMLAAGPYRPTADARQETQG